MSRMINPIWPNPKLRSKAGQWRGLYHYYAGFSSDFAEFAVSTLLEKPGSMVLDPWNGSGTSTTAAARAGHRSEGRDLNPVMRVVARARSAPADLADSIYPLLEHLLATSEPCSVDRDPLREWFDGDTAALVRGIERAIAKSTRGGLSKVGIKGAALQDFSSLTAILYLCLFSSLKRELHSFRASNPTWIKSSQGVQLHITKQNIFDGILNDARLATRHLMSEGLSADSFAPYLYSSSSEDRRKRKFDLILTSPPYCTRIDYAQLTKVELALMGIGDSEFKDLRRRLMGSVLTGKQRARISKNIPTRCRDFLHAVKRHSSRASSTYYYKQHVQYYNSLASSVKMLSKQVTDRGYAIFVVQDSWYKELHNDLQGMLAEIASESGLHLVNRADFPVQRSFADIHLHATKYRENRPLTESVLTFQLV